MKVSHSWSKPDGVPGLIARKQVDKTMFLTGSHIPEAFHEDFAQANGGDLPRVGESREVTLICEGRAYEAKLIHQPRGPQGGRYLLYYSEGSEFPTLLRERLPFSYQRFVAESADADVSPEAIPGDEREYVEFYETREPYRYLVRLVTRSDSTQQGREVPPSDFSRVWADLGRIIGSGIGVRTLARGVVNRVNWLGDDGIQVITDRGSDTLPKSMFEDTWDTLVRRGILAADDMPSPARFRSTAICAILAQLPYVDYTTYPRIQLFLTTHRFTNAQLSETFKVGNIGGIRVAGQYPDTKQVVFITSQPEDSRTDHPYQDHWEGDIFFYTGEGLQGPQQMTAGNRALQNNIERDFPVYGFQKLSDGGYSYLGRFKVLEVIESEQPDIDGNPRRVYVFKMKRVGPEAARAETSKAWVFQASPEYYRLSNAVRELTEIPFLVKQFAKEIRAGDRVYLWEAGPNAGLVAVGTVLTDPAEMPDREESRPFYVRPEKFEGIHTRVIVRIDRRIEPALSRSALLNHPILRNLTVLKVRAGTNFRLTPQQEQALIELLGPVRAPEFFRIVATRNPELWEASLSSDVLFLDRHMPSRDLRSFDSDADLKGDLLRGMGRTYEGADALADRWVEQLNTVKGLRAGDKLIVTRGPSTIVGLAEVESPGYVWLADQSRHGIKVRWIWQGWRRVPRHPRWQVEMISPARPDLYETIRTSPTTLPVCDLAAVAKRFSRALQACGLRFGERHEEQVRSFIAALATKRFVILTGLSGSGKTQIALRFGDWLGPNRRLLVPVRPDWTGPDALFGYEDALRPPVADGRRPWHVPDALAFMLKAARDPDYPYLLILDEMNLAHVERYFADFLSGIESGEPCLPNLEQDAETGQWLLNQECKKIPVPENLFVVGTVNVDETTYMFSPKVLDRANTFEFRVETDDLQVNLQKPLPVEPGPDELVRGFLAIAADEEWQRDHPAPGLDQFASHFRTLHRLLADGDFEFGHRVFYEALRYASMLASAGNASVEDALDQQVYQKILPRLHGSRRRLEPTLRALGRFCWDLTYAPAADPGHPFDPENPGSGEPKLPLSFRKVRRMFRSLLVNHFTSFTE